jgi:hypothetical protein
MEAVAIDKQVLEFEEMSSAEHAIYDRLQSEM